MFYSYKLHSLNIVEYPFTSSAAIKWQNNDQDAERFILWFLMAGEQCKGILFCTFAAVQLENYCLQLIENEVASASKWEMKSSRRLAAITSIPQVFCGALYSRYVTS